MTSYLGRQAVVIVHGIGEQRPLSTLMGFVAGGAGGTEGVLREQDRNAWYVGPDHVTNRLDLRRITINFGDQVPLPSNGGVQVSRMARQTQFFEYYWANRFRDTQRRHLTEWARPLLFTRREGLSQPALIGPQGWRRHLGLSAAVLAWLGVAISLVGLFQGANELVPPELVPEGRRWLWASAAVLALVAIAVAGRLGLVTMLRVLAALVLTFAAAAVLEGLGDSGREELMWSWTLASAAVALAAFLGSRRLDWPPLGWLTAAGGISLVASLVSPALAAPAARAGLGVLAAAAVTLLTGLVGGVLLNVVGDAARYFTNNPGNLEDREAIRVGLVELLSALHDRRDPVTGQHEYDRIVVVGHSLGSVIAYDALNALWARRSPLLGLSYDKGAASSRLERLLREAEDCVRRHPGNDAQHVGAPDDPGTCTGEAPEPFDRDAYRAVQDQLLRVTRADSVDPGAGERQPEGSRWIVSDLVTLGSPLTYAEALLVQGGRAGLAQALHKRLLTRCPPMPQRSASQGGTPLRFRWWKGPGRGHATHFHHVAAFAATRWTNLYYADDFVGGPLAPQLGQGIQDIQLPRSANRRRFLSFLVFMPHTKYWQHAQPSRGGPRGFDESVTTIREVLTTFPLVAKVRILPRQVTRTCEVISRQDYLASVREADSDAEVRLQVYRPSATGVDVRSWWLWGQAEVWCPADRLSDLVDALVGEAGLKQEAIRIG